MVALPARPAGGLRRRWRASGAIEFLLITPYMIAGLLAIITFSLALYAQFLGANAAAHAARVASVTQSGRSRAAITAARSSLVLLPFAANWDVKVCGAASDTCTASADADALGALLRVEVYWEAPNFVGAWLPLMSADPLQGIASATFRNEGW